MKNDFTEPLFMLSEQIRQRDWALVELGQLRAKLVTGNQKLDGLRGVQALVPSCDLFNLGNERLQLFLFGHKRVGILENLVERIQLVLQPVRFLKRSDQLIQERD